MSIRIVLSVVSCCLCVNILCSQNLVPDSSFEDVNISKLLCDWTRDYYEFDDEMNSWENPTGATPDIFSLLVNTYCWTYAYPNIYDDDWDFCSIGEQMPRSGNVMAGILTVFTPGDHYREYLHAQLIEPLEVGRYYLVIFYASLADKSVAAADKLGVYFSLNAIDDTLTITNLPFIPQVEYTDTIKNDTSWVKLESTLIAPAPWEYITIGNFRNDFQTHRIPHNGSCSLPYYFIDDVSVIKVSLQISGDSVICLGEKLTLTAKNTTTFKWAEISDPTTVLSTDSILIVSPKESTTYLLCGLRDTAYFSVTVLPTPILSYHDSCEMNWAVVQLSAEDGTPPYSFHWSNGNTGAFQPKVNDGLHVITVSDVNQCKDTITVTTTCVEQGSIINIPQAFTPNGDGRNDFLPIFGDAGIISKYEFSIFNRWGNLVYFTNDLNNITQTDLTKGWDGTYKGEKQETGVYVYSLQVEFVNGKKRVLTGNITLIR